MIIADVSAATVFEPRDILPRSRRATTRDTPDTRVIIHIAASKHSPTDTAIVRHISNIKVLESLVWEYRVEDGLITPRKPSDASIASTTATYTVHQKEDKKQDIPLKE